ncbi:MULTISPECIES: hypothetical protein [Enterobacteriaceae]|nr:MULTISPECIES: hypothetical protein [Enterobacteriaceae]MDA2943941.1 hypothetical protein [Enterobacter cloacae]MDQ1782989.1 hypothetical protein [Klebsiella pneumoniae subsp. pneumoniae]MDQ1797183.1 hypothetical protein [Klebsiella pneumoniae subsp. pneumoniae]MDQ1869641.1 hypothetical protein [Klebsiella pneumoniae subsp. pneumoniae]MDT0847948.1 hypothetical protein [Klebsiella pneumoniae subsp. pneumoniae]
MMSEPVAALISGSEAEKWGSEAEKWGSEAEKWAAKAVFLANSAATD